MWGFKPPTPSPFRGFAAAYYTNTLH